MRANQTLYDANIAVTPVLVVGIMFLSPFIMQRKPNQAMTTI